MEDSMKVLSICMGSACHQHRVYDVLPKLEALLDLHRVRVRVEIKGSFCLGPCMQAIVMKMGERMFKDINPGNVEEKFVKEILPAIQEKELV